MAKSQIGYGYGSEWQLLRFMGRHRKELETKIREVIGAKGNFDWLDFEYKDRRSEITGDNELLKLDWINRNIIDATNLDSVKNEFKRSKLKINWDAIFIVDNTIFLVEAKAHKDEFESDCRSKREESKRTISDFLKKYLDGKADITKDLLNKHYQFVNRLATASFLQKSLQEDGINAKVLYICFENGFFKQNVGKNGRKYSTKDIKDALEKDFRKVIDDELKALNTTREKISNIYAGEVYIDAAPKG